MLLTLAVPNQSTLLDLAELDVNILEVEVSRLMTDVGKCWEGRGGSISNQSSAVSLKIDSCSVKTSAIIFLLFGTLTD